MATAVTDRRRWTYADLEEVPDDDLIYDILGGELVVRNAPDMNHGELLTELIGLLITAQRAGYGRMYTSTTAVALDFAQRGMAAEDVPHPDLFFVRQDRLSFRGDRGWEGVPDLVIEIISPSTRREHRPGGKWWDAYARNGVPHYWQADPQARELRQCALLGEPYVAGHYGDAITLQGDDLVTSPLFPDVAVPARQRFARVRLWGRTTRTRK